jgi:hypothetical protein
VRPSLVVGSRPCAGYRPCSPSSSPAQAKRDITALQAKKMLASVRPRDIAGRNGPRNYQVSVLEVVDENTPDETIEQIES